MLTRSAKIKLTKIKFTITLFYNQYIVYYAYYMVKYLFEWHN